MAVFTSITFDDLNLWLQQYNLGKLLDFQGISSGVTNTNYLITTDSKKYIVTIFEDTKASELPFYLNLMAFLSNKGLSCPQPIFNNAKEYLTSLKNKPALVVSFLKGHERKNIILNDCFEVGLSLANFHVKGKNFPEKQENKRGLDWIEATFFNLKNNLIAEDIQIISNEISYQKNNIVDQLPSGTIHGDLFVDNVLFEADNVSGLIDLYYACHDKYIYDIAIAINDWCLDDDLDIELKKIKSLIDGYESIKKLDHQEVKALPKFLRLAALRFWLSRLNDFHNSREGEEVNIKDPAHFKKILLKKIEH